MFTAPDVCLQLSVGFWLSAPQCSLLLVYVPGSLDTSFPPRGVHCSGCMFLALWRLLALRPVVFTAPDVCPQLSGGFWLSALRCSLLLVYVPGSPSCGVHCSRCPGAVFPGGSESCFRTVPSCPPGAVPGCPAVMVPPLRPLLYPSSRPHHPERHSTLHAPHTTGNKHT